MSQPTNDAELYCHIGLRVTKVLKERLRAVADGRSTGFLVTRALEEYLAREEAKL